MNYYERHLGDYARDTGHLSLLEHGVYTLLLDRYYATEKGIPIDQIYRVARARSKEEKEAVDAVLNEFFTLFEGVYLNERAEAEIEKTRARIQAARLNGAKGGRPKTRQQKEQESEKKVTETRVSKNFFQFDESEEKSYPQPVENSETLENKENTKPTGFSLGYENETQPKALHTPYTIHHIKILSKESNKREEKTNPATACLELRKAGVTANNPSHPKLLQLCEAGATLEDFQKAGEAVRTQKPQPEKPFTYALGVVKSLRERAKEEQAKTNKGARHDRYAVEEPI